MNKKRSIKKARGKSKESKETKKQEIPLDLQEKGKSFNEVTEFLFKKVKGKINGSTKTLAEFRKEIKPYLNPGYLPVNVGLEVTFYNKTRYAIITHTAWGYDCYIPRTDEDEERLKRETGYYDE